MSTLIVSLITVLVVVSIVGFSFIVLENMSPM